MSTVSRCGPDGLGAGGSALWAGITADRHLDAIQLVTLHEACRVKDRLDRLDAMIRADTSEWADVGDGLVLHLDAEHRVNATADLLKQLLGSLRLPDKYGRRPQRRGAARGVYRMNARARR